MIVPPLRRERQAAQREGHPMLELNCDRCHRELREPGALIFSPPTDEAWLVEKYHVCTDCWPSVTALLNDKSEKDRTSR
jgi:hypothetical protein